MSTNRYNQKQDTTLARIGTMSESAATGAVGTTKSALAYLKQIVTDFTAYFLSVPRCVTKSDGSVETGDDALFVITGGPVLAQMFGVVTTIIGGASSGKLTQTTTVPAATIDLSASAVAIDTDAAGTSYRHINTTAILTPVTAGSVMTGNAFATQDVTFLLVPGTVYFNCTAAQTGVIAWHMRFIPLSPLSRVTAAA
jgi:hypothetical protein